MSENPMAVPPAPLIKVAPLPPGSRSDSAGKAISNVILLALPDQEYDLLRPYLEPLDLPQHKILHESGEKIDFTYFLNDGMASLVALSRDGRSVEVGIIGKEGMVGMSLTAGLLRGTFRAIIQISRNRRRVRPEISLDSLGSVSSLRSELSPLGRRR